MAAKSAILASGKRKHRLASGKRERNDRKVAVRMLFLAAPCPLSVDKLARGRVPRSVLR